MTGIPCPAKSNLHHLLVFRHEDFGFRLHRAQGFGVGRLNPELAERPAHREECG